MTVSSPTSPCVLQTSCLRVQEECLVHKVIRRVRGDSGHTGAEGWERGSWETEEKETQTRKTSSWPYRYAKQKRNKIYFIKLTTTKRKTFWFSTRKTTVINLEAQGKKRPLTGCGGWAPITEDILGQTEDHFVVMLQRELGTYMNC